MRQDRQSGVSLIEVLVTLVILSIGLLGIAGMQVMSVKNTQVAAQRSIATQQAYDIAERMRANIGRLVALGGPAGGAVNGSYDNLDASTPADPACGGACTPVQQAVADHRAWNLENARVLPAGSGTVVGTMLTGYVVTLNWTEQSEAGPVGRSFATTVNP
jgi:type IV pilus assembly protein PilV